MIKNDIWKLYVDAVKSFGTIVLKDLQNGILGRNPVGPSDRDQKNVFDEKEERKHLDKFIKLYVSCNND